MNQISKFSTLMGAWFFLLSPQYMNFQDIEWFESNHEWYFAVDCMISPGCGYVHYSVAADTLIAGVAGVQLNVSTLEETGFSSFHSEILRYNEDTVFRFSPEAGRWHMLYDFGAAPGDVWNIQDEEFLGYHVEGSPDSLFRVVVDSVDVMVLGGIERRMIYTSGWSDGMNHSHFDFGLFGFILEGVGPTGEGRSLIGQSYGAILPPYPAGFRCFLSGGELVFGSSESPCNFLSTSGLLESKTFLPYPNPTQNHLFIDRALLASELIEIRIIDLNGRTLVSKTMLNENRLDVSSLPAGTYLVEIASADKHYTSRFVKMP